jgi:hypothetical protein
MFVLSQEANSVVLPSPNYKDKLSVKYKKIINKTRGNELIISKKIGFDYLHSVRTYNYQFSYFDPIVRYNLLNFIQATTGQLITVTDYDDEVYNGIILTPSNDIVQSGRNNNEYNLEVEVIDDIIGDFIPTQGLNSNKMITQGFGL